MRALCWGTLLIVAACAGPAPSRAPHAETIRRFTSTVEASDLKLARVLLVQARPELEPRQWEMLNEKLSAAERAWALYEAARPGARQREKASSPFMSLGAAAEQGASHLGDRALGVGTGSSGPSSPNPQARQTRCEYRCGMYRVELYIFSKRAEDCDERRNLDRAEDEANEKALR